MIQELRERISQVLPETPFAAAKEKLSWACRELCVEANVWAYDRSPVVSVDELKGRILIPRAEALRIDYLIIRGRKEKPGRLYQQTGPQSVEFYSDPAEYDLEGVVFCRPTLGGVLPDPLLSRWSEVIVNGALWQLFMLPHSMNAERADYHRRLFFGGVSEAKSNAMLGHGNGGARVKMRPFI